MIISYESNISFCFGFQQSGEWEKALAVAKSYDRIHLSDTHFSYAKHLEAMDRIGEAIEQYEASGTHM